LLIFSKFAKFSKKLDWIKSLRQCFDWLESEKNLRHYQSLSHKNNHYRTRELHRIEIQKQESVISHLMLIYKRQVSGKTK